MIKLVPFGGVRVVQGLKEGYVYVAGILEIIYLRTCYLYSQCKHELEQK